MIGTRITAALLIMLGIALILVVVWLALNRNVFEAIALSIPAAIVFRSGVGLMRMATAAQLAIKLRKPVEMGMERRR